MNKSKLLWYSEAEGCNGKLFKGEMTLEEFYENVAIEKCNFPVIKSKAYSEALQTTVESDAIQIGDQIINSAVFENGMRFRITKASENSVSLSIDHGGDKDWAIRAYNELLKRELKNKKAKNLKDQLAKSIERIDQVIEEEIQRMKTELDEEIFSIVFESTIDHQGKPTPLLQGKHIEASTVIHDNNDFVKQIQEMKIENKKVEYLRSLPNTNI